MWLFADVAYGDILDVANGQVAVNRGFFWVQSELGGTTKIGVVGLCWA